jgi:transcriptional regulator with XRE-family HTH domain
VSHTESTTSRACGFNLPIICKVGICLYGGEGGCPYRGGGSGDPNHPATTPEMRRLRESSGMTREEVSERTSINEATIYRLESARVRRPQKRTLAALLDLYGVVDPHRAELLELGRNGVQQGWLQPYHSELPEEYTTYIAFEAEARSVSNYESLFAPGLLQTEAYAHAVITGVLPRASEHEVEQRVRARIERQRLLSEPGTLKLWAILDEAALHREVDGRDVMRRPARAPDQGG